MKFKSKSSSLFLCSGAQLWSGDKDGSRRHRLNGPAVIHSNGFCAWWKYGECITYGKFKL